MKAKNKLGNVLNIKGNMDFGILFTLIFFIAFGVVMVNSSSFNILLDSEGGTLPLLKQVWVKQMVYGIVAILIMLLGSLLQIKFITKVYFIFPAYIAVLTLLGIVSFFGDESRGAARSFDFKVISFQPSEFAKIIVIVLLATLVQRWRNHLNNTKALIYLVLVLLPPVGFVALEDFSTAAVILLTGGLMIFVSYQKWLETFIGGLGGLAMMGVFFLLKDNRKQRFTTYSAGVWSDADGAGRQGKESILAIGSGGFFGRGLGQSLQKMGKITQAHHDIIFAVISEELGIVGAFLVLLGYLFLIYQMYQVAINSTEIRDFLIIFGIICQISAQVAINVSVAGNLIPNTGMPLPFISYGGSSMLVLALEMALVLSISRKNNYRYLKELEEIEENL